MERIPGKDLRPRAWDVSIPIDWEGVPREDFSDVYDADGNRFAITWNFWHSVECEGAMKPFVVWNTCDDEVAGAFDTREEAEEFIADEPYPDDCEIRVTPRRHFTDGDGQCVTAGCENFEDYPQVERGPMMGYYYPFSEPSSFDPADAATLIADLPVCVVVVGDVYGLALTGGGMDLTWEICEAFTRLGMLPPVNHLDLPNMAGGYRDVDTEQYVLAACVRAARVRIGWLQDSIERLERYERD